MICRECWARAALSEREGCLALAARSARAARRGSGGCRLGGRDRLGGNCRLGGTVGSGGAVGSGGNVGMGGMTGSGGVMGTGGRGGTGLGAGGNGTGGGGTGGAAIDPDLVLWYKFDDANGMTASDSSGNARAGTLTNVGTGTAAFSNTPQVGTGSVNLTSTNATIGGYIVIPASLQTMGATTAVTISCWVNMRTARAWQRVFDFGSSSTTTYMFLSVQQSMTTPNSPRFGITRAGNTMEQVINMTTPAALSTGVWHHMAVVLGAGTTYTGTLYIDNVAVGTNAAMTFRPSDLGNSTNNWLGRSQFSTADPLFDGQLDDFRVYKRALTGAEITTLFTTR